MVNKGSFSLLGTMSLNFALFVLYQLVTSASEPESLQIITTLILRKDGHQKIESLMKNPVMDPKDYHYSWNKLDKQHVEFSLVRYQ